LFTSKPKFPQTLHPPWPLAIFVTWGVPSVPQTLHFARHLVVALLNGSSGSKFAALSIWTAFSAVHTAVGLHLWQYPFESLSEPGFAFAMLPHLRHSMRIGLTTPLNSSKNFLLACLATEFACLNVHGAFLAQYLQVLPFCLMSLGVGELVFPHFRHFAFHGLPKPW
jgi:hypothetical protein